MASYSPVVTWACIVPSLIISLALSGNSRPASLKHQGRKSFGTACHSLRLLQPWDLLVDRVPERDFVPVAFGDLGHVL